jgi:hypothetical protein
MKTISNKSALLLIPVLLALHNLEEAATMPFYFDAFSAQLPSVARTLIGEVRPWQFYLVLALITILPFVFLAIPTWGVSQSPSTGLLLVVQLIAAINTLAHVARAAQLHGYTPGLISGLVLNLPFSFYLLGRAWRERWVRRMTWIWLLLAALVVHGPVLLGMFWLASLLG